MKITLSLDDQTTHFDLSDRPVIIGRTEKCDFVVSGFNSEVVSGSHAILKLIDGGLTIEDLGSSNGTYLNGKRCQGLTRLDDSTTIRLGKQGPKLGIQLVRNDAVESSGSSGSRSGDSGPDAKVVNRSFLGSSSPSVQDAPAAQPFGAPETSPASSPPIPASASSASKPDGASSKGSTTRQLLISLQKRNNLTWIIAGSVGAVAVITFAIIAVVYWIDYSKSKQESTNKINQIAGKQELTDEELKQIEESQKEAKKAIAKLKDHEKEIYRKTVQATAFITNYARGASTGGRGSGFLVDKDKGYIVTNHHVVDNGKNAIDRSRILSVWFPQKNSSGDFELNLMHYRRNVKPLKAEIIKSLPGKDLALIKVNFAGRYPDIKPLKLSSKNPEPGDKSYTSGSPGSVKKNGWVFSGGNVKTIIKSWTGGYKSGQVIVADVIVTDNTIEGGDSGGPVVNGNGDLIGVVANLSRDARLQNQFIAVDELRKFLDTYAK